MNAELEHLKIEMERLSPWYHKIDLGPGLVTPGQAFDPIWEMIRKTRTAIDYDRKAVLDIASWDGMWAFEAEQLGAELVIASETAYKKIYNFLFCQRVLQSRVIPFYNISAYNLSERLDVCYSPFGGHGGGQFDGFDVVHHLGLMYHLSDPILSLLETRSVMKENGLLLLETAYGRGESSSMLFNGIDREHGRILSGRNNQAPRGKTRSMVLQCANLVGEAQAPVQQTQLRGLRLLDERPKTPSTREPPA